MPRSPARDLSDRYTGKRGYFRTPDAIRRGKYLFAALAIVAAGGWAAVDIFEPSRAAYGHSHGPLANPHAAFDDNCAACHASYSFKDAFSIKALNVRDRWHDFTCGKCHAGSDDLGFAHHASASDKALEFHKRCSNCHHDHLGRLNSLVRLSDQDCNQCHSNLTEWYDKSKSLAEKAGVPYQNKVTNFVTDHPDFRSLNIEKKPRTLTFSHAVHMNPGQTYTPGGKEAMTLARIAEWNGPEMAARYKANEAGLVQLECASCHTLDSGTGSDAFDKTQAALSKMGEPTKSLFPPRAAGAYFLPTNYEASCRACHPLQAPAGSSDVGDKKFVIPGFDVAHRKQPAELLADLKAGYLKGMIAEKHPLLENLVEPGGKLDPPPPVGKSATLGVEAERLAKAAQRQLFSADAGCAKCHKTEPPNPAPDALFAIKPVPDRTVWFEHAKFNHAAHRGATCASCHPGTEGRAISPVDANKPEPVLIRGADSCRACHSPSNTKVNVDGVESAGGGIRHNCTDCHNYHHGDMPLQGRGSSARNPRNPRDIADWLKGK